MTRLAVSYYRSTAESDTIVIDAEPDDIGEAEVIEALQTLNPFDEIERDSIEWDVLDD